MSLKVSEDLLKEYEDIEQRLLDPSIHQNQNESRRILRRYAYLGRIVKTAKLLEDTEQELLTAKELEKEDESFSVEVAQLESRVEEVHNKLISILSPDSQDNLCDVILEVKAGAGGEESALFAADLARMYFRYAEVKNWTVVELSSTPTPLGGFKDITLAIRAKDAEASGDGVWAHLKYEGGVHRVQRVPVTESQGRLHTSAVGVFVMPEIDDDDTIEIDQNDLRIDVYRSSGPGGQSVNTTDSAVRITHLPTGIVVSMQNEKSQLQNKEAALRILHARLLAEAKEKKAKEEAQQRNQQVRTVDRSERIRTYNFPENRIVDHRTGYKAYNLDQVLEGALDPVINSAIAQHDSFILQSATV